MAPPELKPGPVTRVCHVCGRQYGLSSFDIHLKQCKKLFIAQEELKPKAERRPVPKTPPGLDGLGARGGGSGDDGCSGGGQPTREMVEAMNRAAQETYNEHGMEKCENCGRTFAEGRLAIHAKSCRPGNAARRVEEGAAPRNKKETALEQSQPAAVKKSATRPPAAERDEREDSAPTRPSTGSSAGSGASRPLAGSLASNRKKIASQDPASIQSPLGGPEINVDALKRELEGKSSMVDLIEAKLNHWEASTLATLQEIRDLKQLFAQLATSTDGK